MASSPLEMASSPHFVIFPFMSKGHTIPLLHLSRLLFHRRIKLTIITTTTNRPFIARFLGWTSDDPNIIDLPFPSQVQGIPQGIESTDKLPSISLFLPFATATKIMQPHFEQALGKLSHVTAIVSDGFLSWTLESANKFGIPRLSFLGMNNYVGAVCREVFLNRLLSGPESDDDLITVAGFPWIKITRNDFDKPLNQRVPATDPHLDFIIESSIATANSHGLISNSFYELEPLFVDYLNSDPKPKVWCVGPLCLAEPQPPMVEARVDHHPRWMGWLDQKLAQKRPVVYVAFGSQAEISIRQLEEISKGLEESQVSFLWVVRKDDEETIVVMKDLEERVGERGLIVREWVDQMGVLKHESVKGFVSHCGWNSVLEGICWKVPILAWPMMAEQHLNARMVVEEIKIGLRVETCDGSVRGFVKADGLRKMVKELMEGEKGKEVREKVEEIGEGAKKAMAKGGSSWRTLNELIDELQRVRLGSDESKGESYIPVDDLHLLRI
uniref:Glycosyltransferase n=1 Tax=Carthamus tinctorius TaxID=4222 RepID=A0A1B1V008_CARTI|nr:UDP-glycosyltransferase 25 [Carthamus tinctorius]